VLPLATATAQIPGMQSVARNISVDFHDADIRSVLLAFSEFSGVSIVASKNVTGHITARIADQPWDKALLSLLESNGLAVRDIHGILNVDTIESIRANEELENLMSQIFRLNFQKADEIAPTVTALLSERGKLQADPGSNSILVIDIPDRIDKIGEVLAELDNETRQVEISVKLTFVNKRSLREMGIDWRMTNQNNPLTDTRFGVDVGSAANVVSPHTELALGTVRKGVNINAVLRALEDMNQARTVANPVITTLNNLPAKVLVGQRTPLRVVDYGAQGGADIGARATTQMVETGVKLEVIPQITQNDKVLVQLLAENSDADSGPEGIFFRTQEANTRLLLDNGATGIIAGLTVFNENNVSTGIPVLRSVPLLGRLFSYEKQSTEEEELVIIITTRIINPGEQSGSLMPHGSDWDGGEK
jgi:type IV pilus assembly protein PilQ